MHYLCHHIQSNAVCHFLCFFTPSARSAIACWATGELATFDLKCNVSDGPISILSSMTSVSTCTFTDVCCIYHGDCTVTSPENAMANLYGCEGQYSCSVAMKQIHPLPGCGSEPSNYQVVYYRCGDSTTMTTG